MNSLRFALILAPTTVSFPAFSTDQRPPVPKKQDRPQPPPRPFDAPRTPKFARLDGKPGVNPPVNVDGDFLVGPEYLVAPETKVVAWVPAGKVQQFSIDSKDCKRFNPGMTRPLGCLLLALLLLPPGLAAQTTYNPNTLPKGREYFGLRDGIANAQLKFQREKTGRIAFLGGSITAGGGWRDHTMKYFQAKFPQTKFEFIGAGIGSMGSVPHAFRLERDVLSKGSVDLLFVEAAVNDSSNIPDLPEQMLRGMEGVVRHARAANPLTDIVHLHFVMPSHMDDYNQGRVPASIAQHERVALAYGNPSLHLALEVTDRINAGEFTWNKDFIGLHPSPFGHQLYANSIARMLDTAFAKPPAAAAKPHALPAFVDAQSYANGRLEKITEATNLKGFGLEQAWKPTDQKGTRPGFVGVPALIGTKPGAEFEFSFEGTGCGLFIAAGPDAGRIEFSIDGGAYRPLETFTHWSAGLHLPWALILDDQLKPGRHTAKVRIAASHDPKGTGTALRVFHLLLN